MNIKNACPVTNAHSEEIEWLNGIKSVGINDLEMPSKELLRALYQRHNDVTDIAEQILISEEVTRDHLHALARHSLVAQNGIHWSLTDVSEEAMWNWKPEWLERTCEEEHEANLPPSERIALVVRREVSYVEQRMNWLEQENARLRNTIKEKDREIARLSSQQIAGPEISE